MSPKIDANNNSFQCHIKSTQSQLWTATDEYSSFNLGRRKETCTHAILYVYGFRHVNIMYKCTCFRYFISLNVKKFETEFQTHKYISNSYTTKT